MAKKVVVKKEQEPSLREQIETALAGTPQDFPIAIARGCRIRLKMSTREGEALVQQAIDEGVLVEGRLINDVRMYRLAP